MEAKQTDDNPLSGKTGLFRKVMYAIIPPHETEVYVRADPFGNIETRTKIGGPLVEDIERELASKKMMPGTIEIVKFDPQEGEVSIRSFVPLLGAGARQWRYTLSRYGTHYYTDGKEERVTEPKRLEKCERLLAVVASHDPRFKRLEVLGR